MIVFNEKERVSPEGYSVTADEKLYLRRLCEGPKTAAQIADEVTADPSVSKAHPPATVADRLAYLARYGGTEHLVERDGDRYRLTEDGEMGNGSMREGVLTGIQEGYFQREIQESAYEYQQRVEAGEETVVGVNAYETDEDTEPDILTVDEDVQERQRDRLAAVKKERDDEAVEAALAELETVTRNGENVVPAIVDAVKAYATMGEIMGVFKDEFGSYQETISAA